MQLYMQWKPGDCKNVPKGGLACTGCVYDYMEIASELKGTLPRGNAYANSRPSHGRVRVYPYRQVRAHSHSPTFGKLLLLLHVESIVPPIPSRSPYHYAAFSFPFPTGKTNTRILTGVSDLVSF